jgi:hypothetical protein
MPIQCTGILDNAMFTCGHFERVALTYDEYMTTLQIPRPVAVIALDTPEAQEARWIAWKSKGAAADRITQRRVRIAFTVILVALGGVALAMVL